MTFQTNFYVVISFAILIAILESCAQNSIKQSEIYKCEKRFYMGLFFYIAVSYVLYKAYKDIGLGQMNLVWSCFSIILALSAGHLFYKEPFNKYTALSMTLAFAAIITAFLSTKYQLQCEENENKIITLQKTLEQHLKEKHSVQ